MAEGLRTDQELLRDYAGGDRAAFDELYRRYRAPLWFDADHSVFMFLNNVNHGARYEGGITETWAYRYKEVDEGGTQDAFRRRH